jgi:hypothetical protein
MFGEFLRDAFILKITVDFSILAPKHQMQIAVITAIIIAASGITQLAIL